jgi:hypothetical protein
VGAQRERAPGRREEEEEVIPQFLLVIDYFTSLTPLIIQRRFEVLLFFFGSFMTSCRSLSYKSFDTITISFSGGGGGGRSAYAGKTWTTLPREASHTM